MQYSDCDIDILIKQVLTVEGQIMHFLADGPKLAGEIYSSVKASQSTVSRKIARMVDQGMLECSISSSDRRVPIYRISEKYRRYLNDNQILSALSLTLPVIKS